MAQRDAALGENLLHELLRSKGSKAKTFVRERWQDVRRSGEPKIGLAINNSKSGSASHYCHMPFFLLDVVVPGLGGDKYLRANLRAIGFDGGGDDFVNRFARWVPDRVAAASSHNTVGWDYYEVTPGLHPLEDLKNVPQ